MNRGQLLRLARAGRLVAVDSYHFDDMHGSSRTQGRETPIHVLAPGEWATPGLFCVHEWDFKASSGHVRPDGRPDHWTLYVHSNSNYTVRVLS